MTTVSFYENDTWTAPDDVVSPILVSGGGGGGGGGGGWLEYDEEIMFDLVGGGGGGGAGQIKIDQEVAVTAGVTYTITVGAAGLGGAAHSPGTDGETTSMKTPANSVIFSAGAGNGGGVGFGGTGGTGYGEDGDGETIGGSGPGGKGGDSEEDGVTIPNSGGEGSPDNTVDGEAGASCGGGGGGWGDYDFVFKAGGDGGPGFLTITYEIDSGEEVEADATLNATISLASSVAKTAGVSTTLNTTISTASNAIARYNRSTTINGTATLNADENLIFKPTTNIAATASVSAAPINNANSSSNIAATASVLAAPINNANSSSNITATASVSAAGSANYFISSVLPTSIDIEADATVQRDGSVSTVLSCECSLDSAAEITAAVSSDLNTSINIDANAGLSKAVAADLSLDASLSSNAVTTKTVASTLVNTANISAAVIANTVSNANLIGTGNLTAIGALNTTASASLLTSSNFVGDVISFVPTATNLSATINLAANAVAVPRVYTLSGNNLVLKLSGGGFNEYPEDSLGGLPSQSVIKSGQLSNLFNSNIDRAKNQTVTNYRCVYLHNTNPTDTAYNLRLSMSEQMAGGALVAIGVPLRNEIQQIVIVDEDDIVSGSFVLSLGQNILDEIVWQDNVNDMITAITAAIENIFDVDVSVTNNSSGSNRIFEVEFTGTSEHKLFPLIAVESNDLSPNNEIKIISMQRGTPINDIATNIAFGNNAPYNVTFVKATDEPIEVGSLAPGEYCQIWFKRQTTSNASLSLELDSFTLSMSARTSYQV